MTKTLLHIDSSARIGNALHERFGSHSRRLSQRFAQTWMAQHPDTQLIYRDVGQEPPSPVNAKWIHAAFTPTGHREPWMHETLKLSDTLVDELLSADLIVAGVPMYNFGPPAQFKAWIDNIIRVGRTFGFDRNREGDPYWPLLTGHKKQLIVLSSRGDYGYNPGERIAHMNHVENSIRTAFAYMGVTDFHAIAAEYDEFGDDRQAISLHNAERSVDQLVAQLTTQLLVADPHNATFPTQIY